MQAITTIGLDIEKSVFQVHGIDAVGNVVIRRRRGDRMTAYGTTRTLRNVRFPVAIGC
jgi:hypothetical protein